MKKNIGTADKIIRIVLALAAAVLIVTETVSGTAALIIGIIGVVMLLTGLAGFCGLYSLLGISTAKKKT